MCIDKHLATRLETDTHPTGGKSFIHSNGQQASTFARRSIDSTRAERLA